MLRKTDLRASILNERKKRDFYVTQKEETQIEESLLLTLDTNISILLAYWPLVGEISLCRAYRILCAKGARLYFPRLLRKEEGQMDFYSVELSDLPTAPTESLWEPVESEKFASQKKVPILVPSLALDFRGTRLGFGGGYYDRYLARFPNLLRIAPQHSRYILKHSIPHESWDISMHMAISEQGLQDFRK